MGATAMIRTCALYFTAPYRVELRDEVLLPLKPGEVLVQAHCSAISPGTELLLYRGQMPQNMKADSTISALQSNLAYPLKYGYAVAGEVEAVGEGVSKDWLGRRVFAFHPHQHRFIAPLDDLHPVPADIPFQHAVFLPNVETAVNLVQDGQPLLGERVIVFGAGVVGLLVTALLARFPLASLWVVDYYALRRETALRLGADRVFSPDDLPAQPEADLIFEVSGNPVALNQAISVIGFGGRIVIGSWYGSKSTALDLGGKFHRHRIRLISSQVSTIAPELGARWTKARRFDLAWDMLRQLDLTQLITHQLPFTEAAEAYRLLDEKPNACIQVLLDYKAD